MALIQRFSVSALLLLALACSDESGTSGTGSTLVQGTSSSTASAESTTPPAGDGTTSDSNAGTTTGASAGGAGGAGGGSGGSSVAVGGAGGAGGAGGGDALPAVGDGVGGAGGSGGATGALPVGDDASAGGAGGAETDSDTSEAEQSGGGAGGGETEVVDEAAGGAGGEPPADDGMDQTDDDTGEEVAMGDGAPNPSPGCGKGGRPDGGKVYNASESWLVFPEKYDGNTPLPVLWGWHGCGSYNFGDASRTEYWDETRNTPFEPDYVIAIPLAASGDCFNYDTDIVRTKQLYDELTQNYCVDLDRMFGTGHSSGANFLHRMLQDSHSADWEYLGLRGIAPVASGPVNNHTSQVPAMYIHSPNESVDPQGPAENFRNANGCGMDSTPYDVGSCNSKDGGNPVNANCISYEGCDVTTIFCPHDDSNYSGTYHGIPCFFYQGAYDFFESL